VTSDQTAGAGETVEERKLCIYVGCLGQLDPLGQCLS